MSKNLVVGLIILIVLGLGCIGSVSTNGANPTIGISTEKFKLTESAS
jgi:hypothetical protein